MACEELSQRLAGRKQGEIESIVIEEAATTALEAAQAMAPLDFFGELGDHKTLQNPTKPIEEGHVYIVN